MPEYRCSKCQERYYSAAPYNSIKVKKCERCGAPIYPSLPEERDGLIRKYDVFKVETGEPVINCFVLRPEKDHAARAAIRTYAEVTSNRELSDDLLAWVNELGEQEAIESLRRSREKEATIP